MPQRTEKKLIIKKQQKEIRNKLRLYLKNDLIMYRITIVIAM
jgi:hypothetical protein